MMTARQPHTLLRRLLRRAGYSTSSLVAKAGADRAEEQTIIRRIKGAMIGQDTYPASTAVSIRADTDQIEAWENEGGQPPPDSKA